jgi:Flp pilus assembly protein TadG
MQYTGTTIFMKAARSSFLKKRSKKLLLLGFRQRRAAVAVLFAVMALPITGLVGLAIDYTIWNQVYASMSLAASGAALNAVKVAANGELLANDPNYATEATQAATEWFEAQVGSANAARLPAISPTVTVTPGADVTVTVSYSGTVAPVFGGLFGITGYPLNVSATSTISTKPYLEVVMMLDNSSSMDIAATPAAMTTLTSATPCDPSNAFTQDPATGQFTNLSMDAYDNYQCSAAGNFYNGSFAPGLPTCPAAAPTALASIPNSVYGQTNPPTFPVTNFTDIKDVPPPATYTCRGILPQQNPGTANAYYPLAGPPCAFACHWTTTLSADGQTTDDLFGLARRQGIQLRFDLVKNATNAVLRQMQSDNLSALDNLSVGIYAFNTSVQQVYPDPASCGAPGSPTCEAGTNFAQAQNLVGSAPTLPNVTDTGLLPALAQRAGDNDDTAFPEAMNALFNTYVTAAGTGASAASPRKVLFLVTDGFEDDPNTKAPADRKAFESSYCNQFKTAGYDVYVVYTPYYPVEHQAYFANDWAQFVEQTGPQSISYQLQACSSQGSDNNTYYISAADGPTLTAALQKFLKQALNAPARFTE